MSAPVDLTVSIIDTDNREQTIDCLRSLPDGAREITLEVFVVDNACIDGSAAAIEAEFPLVRLLRNEHRLGFSSNNNLVMGRASGRHVVLLNDDTLVHEGAFDRMVAHLDAHPSVGAVGPRLLNGDGSIQRSIGRQPRPLGEAFAPFGERLRPLDWRGDDVRPVDAISGACLMVRRAVIEEVGPLDTDFDPIYSEEIEWCTRIRKGGWTIHHLPAAVVTHLGSQTMDRSPRRKLALLYQKKALYFRKHGGAPAAARFKAALVLASVAKAVAWTIATPVRGRRAWEKARIHGWIARRAVSL